MTSALIHVHGLKSVPPLVADLEAAGIQVQGVVDDRNQLLSSVVRHAPDVVVVDEPLLSDALFKVMEAIAQTAPCAVLVFTADSDVDHMERAIASGMHAYVVNGYGANRLRALIHLAQVRFRQDQTQRTTLQDLSVRLEERKMVDRAKGILMRTRQVSDDDAFQILRTASMHTNQRLGQVSQHIIHAAVFAEGVNRSGQLRMLSQRLVKLYVLQQAGVQAAQCAEQFQESVQRIDANLAHLGKNLSQSTYGDLLGQVVQTWTRLKPVLQAGPATGTGDGNYAQTDELAEHLLQGAERLTAALESAGLAPPLRVLNLAGRQRMLSQRFAKYALLCLLGDATLVQRAQAGMDESRTAFEEALTYLNGLPLSTPEIRSALEAAGIGWLQMRDVVCQAQATSGAARLERLQALALVSENLLDVFERLSNHYEHGMQMLSGN
ncbi:MAG: type IV pili methyl-accepting chemotaxis transducer N-terminal domain-containing protein [Burkholderiales bacterium]|nr:type IV pili methyl-accepting chemotaxis transducer N-terminal domain-containing protein [Burkholderiales bacterium]